jgi:hypothetical protein
MSLRRGSTLVGFAGGLLFFGEKNGWQKLPAVIGILVGLCRGDGLIFWICLDNHIGDFRRKRSASFFTAKPSA